MRRLVPATAILIILLAMAGCSRPKTRERAEERLLDYAHAVDHDYEQPEKIYPFLTASLRERMTKEAFCDAWAKERTYPYITPLYIWQPEITMDPDNGGGEATFLQAARIVGMTYTVRFVYENGDYYIEDWEQFADGSYLDKFETVVQSIDWYYD